MNQERYNPDDPLFLISRALDGDLSNARRRRLDEALAKSPSLRVQADRLGAVDQLIKRWALQKAGVDLVRFEARVLAKIAEEADREDHGKLDRLLKQWSARRPAVNEEAFVQAVLDKLGRSDRAAPWPRRVFRIGAPLAAAAAVILAVTATIWFKPAQAVVVNVAIGPVSSEVYASRTRTSAQVVVSFARAPVEAAPARVREPGVSFTAVGASAIEWAQEEGFPL